MKQSLLPLRSHYLFQIAPKFPYLRKSQGGRIDRILTSQGKGCRFNPSPIHLGLNLYIQRIFLSCLANIASCLTTQQAVLQGQSCSFEKTAY